MLFTSQKDWKTARAECTKLAGVDGGDLTALTMQDDLDRLAAWVNSTGVNDVWIGLNNPLSLINDRDTWS
jgi:hypothetical protein